MLTKVVALFLVGMAVLAIFGRLRFPAGLRRRRKGENRLAKPAVCPNCGRYMIGPGGCDCGKPPANKG